MAEGQKTKSPSSNSGNGSGLSSQINQSESAKSSVTPEFLKASESNPDKPSNNAFAAFGREGDAARAGEDEVASDKPGQKEAEYKNKVKGKEEAVKAMAGGAGGIGKMVAKNGIKGTMQKAGPVLSFILLTVFFIFICFNTQANMLFGLVSRIGVFDPVDLANSVRSRVLMKTIMRGQNTSGGAWSKLSDKIKNKLGIAGIEVEETADGKTNLKTETETGEIKTVTADTLDNAIDTDNKFLTQYTDGTATVGNSVHSNYSEEGNLLYEGVHVKRGDLNTIKADDEFDTAKAQFDEKVEADVDGSPRMSGEFESDEKTQKQATNPDGSPKTDSDGKPVMVDDVETDSSRLQFDSDADVEGKLDSTLKGEFDSDTKAGIDVSALGKVANGICQVYNTLASISRMVKAYELAQVIVVAFKIFQAIQRMQAGDGGADVLVDVVGTYLVSERTKQYVFGGETFNVVGSAMSSSPIAALFGGAPLSQGDPIVRGFLTTDSEMNNFIRGLDSGSGYRTCIGTQLTASIVDLGFDIASLFTAGIASLVKNFCVSAAFSGIVALGVAFLVPKITNALKRDFKDLLAGPESSGGIHWGGSFVQERLGQMLGFRPATNETWNEYAVERSKLLAERARYDRATKSPFDTSSEYTFMGTIMSSLNTMSLQTTTIFGKAGNILSMVGKSFLNLTPASYADDATDAMVSRGACALNEINGTSEDEIMHCNAFEVAYFVPNMKTIGTPPEDVMWYWQNHKNVLEPTKGGEYGSFESDYDPVDNPNPPVRKWTDLALQIEEYNNRGSELNVADSEIENKYAPATTGSGLADAIIGVIPVGGSIIDIINNGDKAIDINQILGSEYTKPSVANSMAGLYTHDQDMGVAFGAYKESQSVAYMRKYYEEHPLDRSMEGVVARLSGLSKEEVIADMQIVNTYTFVAQYDPTGLGPVIIEDEDGSEIFIEDTDNFYHDSLAVIYSNSLFYKKDQYITA